MFLPFLKNNIVLVDLAREISQGKEIKFIQIRSKEIKPYPRLIWK
jgi:hypothetical protein